MTSGMSKADREWAAERKAQRQETAVERAAKLFTAIRAAAERGDPCPTNADLAKLCRCGTTYIVNGIAFLEANAMISVERGSSRRVVTIRATGQKTAGMVRKPHWSAGKEK